MGDFDFRKHAGGEVPHDDKLADPLTHWELARAGVFVPGGHDGAVVAQAIAHSLVLNCALNRHCPPAILGLVVGIMCKPVDGHTPEVQAEMKEHVLTEVESAIAAIRRGEL